VLKQGGEEVAYKVLRLPYFEYTILLQAAIYLDHCVGVDYQSLGQTANARKLIACQQCAGFGRVTNLFRKLDACRETRR
jgi:hypothetical protein